MDHVHALAEAFGAPFVQRDATLLGKGRLVMLSEQSRYRLAELVIEQAAHRVDLLRRRQHAPRIATFLAARSR